MGVDVPPSGYGTAADAEVRSDESTGTLTHSHKNLFALLAEPSKVVAVLIPPATFETTRRGPSGPISTITVCELSMLADIAASTITVCELIADSDVETSATPVIADICD